jgi:transposase
VETPTEIVQAVATDTLGRRSGPRRLRSIAEKRQIVEETLQPGASVATVARAHEVNANLVFAWRKLYQQGLLEPNAAVPTAPLLPVKVTAPTIEARKRVARRASPAVSSIKAARGDFVEIDLADQRGCVRLHGKAAERILDQLIDDLWPR